MNRLMLSLLVLLFHQSSSAQSFNFFQRKADSLVAANNLDSATTYYDQAINLILKNKESVDQQVWFNTLVSAGNAHSKLSQKLSSSSGIAQYYWNMAYGTKGERLEEKIEFLKDMGVKDLVVYFPHGGMTTEYVLGGCSNNETKFLMWVFGSKTFIQKFDDCYSYKPFAMEKSPFASFYLKHKQQIYHEKLKRFKRLSDSGIYDLTFITEGKTVYETQFHEYDLTDPDPGKKKRPIEEINIPILDYQKNMETQLSKLIPMIRNEINRYLNRINAGENLSAVGKL
ncbi:hypothetical protein ACVWYN_000602 [Pedobacter sp. UYP24]